MADAAAALVRRGGGVLVFVKWSRSGAADHEHLRLSRAGRFDNTLPTPDERFWRCNVVSGAFLRIGGDTTPTTGRHRLSILPVIN